MHPQRQLFTFAESQLLCQFPTGCQALCLHVGNKHKLLQGGGDLLLLPTGGHGGVQTADLDSSGDNVVKATVYGDGDVRGWRNERKVEVMFNTSSFR